MNGALLAAAIVLDACLAALVSPPFEWLVLHPFVWVPAFWILGRVEPRRALWLGALGGFAMMAVLYPWLPRTVIEFSRFPLPAAVAVYLGYAALFGLFLGVFGWGFRAVRRASGSWWPLGIAAWFTACEFLNPQLIPFHQADAWYRVPSLSLVTSATGPGGGTFLVILVNAVVLQALEHGAGQGSSRRALLRNAAVALAALAAAWAVSALRLDAVERAEREVRPLRVALVQPNVYGAARSEQLAADPALLGHDLVALSREAARTGGPIDVFVWSEGALGRTPRSPSNRAVLDFARESGAEIWTGASFSGRHRDEERRPFNSAFRIDTGGGVDRRYDKTVLVPFGEYVPLTRWLPALGRIRGLGRYLPGEELLIYDADRARFAFLICYEAILPRVVGQAVERGVDLLVNLTFDGWFGASAAPHQHLMLAALQAGRFGTPMIRSAGTGISALVDARGVVTERSGLYTREVLVGSVRPLRVPTLYSAWGDWFAWICVAASALLLVRARRSPRA